ncbi:MAG TPA: head-tail adaptor protein [Candidatus Sulfotelmatobacter sp.]|jgi:head-tail adaptor
MSLRRLSSLPPLPGATTPLGAFNRVVTLLQPGAKNLDGTTLLPSPFAVGVWAAIRALSAQEVDKQQQIEQKVSHLVTIPFMQGVTQDMLVSNTFDGQVRTFQIVAIEDADEGRYELRMLCAEIGQSAQ